MKNAPKIITTCFLFIGTFILGITSTFLIIDKYPNLFRKTITKLEKDVTITENGIADAVEKVYDSVIVVSTYKQNQLIGTGSGFIYKTNESEAYLITNHHVVDGGNSFKITFTDGDLVDATLVGSDEYSDIAVLKVENKEGYKAVEIGNSDTMRVGDTTFVVGAPLGDVYSWSVTRGILSGKERLVEVSLSNSYQSDYIMNVLQTDSPVNSGNSGGPISNSNGEVIGVVNAKISSTGVEGIGFAIPIEVAMEKAEQIISGNKSSYPYLGVSMLNVEDARNYINYRRYITDNNINSGVIVIDIEKDSPASKDGMKSGDIITEINGKEVKNVAYLRYELYKYKIGETIKVKVLRDNEIKELSIKLT
ncbi:MAG: trypsin-like peptidase domain-containing protein [Bacilli bacterium]|nr:trypsin-like peptidase domain-containing protein [Bacilli bacterium]